MHSQSRNYRFGRHGPQRQDESVGQMDLFQLKLFQRMSDRMGWLSARQSVLAQNIANADTPEYVPHDMKALTFEDHMTNVAPVMQLRTDPMHMASKTPVGASIDDQKTKKQY